MVIGIVVCVVVLFVVKWRMAHGQRRRAEAEVRQLQHRPLTEFDARYPADRARARGRTASGRRRRSGVGF